MLASWVFPQPRGGSREISISDYVLAGGKRRLW